MNKKLLLSFLLTLVSHFAYCDDIENEIKLIAAGEISPTKEHYLATDSLCVNITTPQLELETGRYGLGDRREDKVEEATGIYTLSLVYNDQTITLKKKDDIDLGNGSDVTVSAQKEMFCADRSLESFVPELSSLTDRTELKLTLTFKVNCVYKEGHNRSATFTSEKVFYVYTCSAGKIAVDESTLPRISAEGSVPIYGLYNANHGLTYTVVSEEDPKIYHLGANEYVTGLIQTNSLSYCHKETKKCTDNNANYGFQYTYADMISATYKMTNGSKRYLTRIYSNSDFSCTSNTIDVELVDTLSIDGFSIGEDTLYVCPSEIADEEDLGIYSENVFTIHGKKVNWNRVSYAPELYDVEYDWEYHTSTSSTWLPVNNNINSDNANNPDLCLAKSFFKQGKSYVFRQVVIIKKFGNWKLYANGDVNHVVVIPYTSIQKSNFTMETLPSYCAGEIISDTLSISFVPSKGFYAPYKESLDKSFELKYNCQSNIPVLNSEVTDSQISFPFNVVGEDTISCLITVEDGCQNTVQLSANINVHKRPQLLKDYFDVENGSVDLSQSNPNILSIQVPQGRNIKLKLNGLDPEQTCSHYYISFKSDSLDSDGNFIWGTRSSINTIAGYTIPSLIAQEHWFSPDCDYIKVEKENLISGCFSNPIYICLQYLCDIFNNQIETGNKMDTLFVCYNTENPSIEGSVVSGGYGENTYSYVWQYSNDGQIWMNMLNAQGQAITSQSLSEGAWNKSIDKSYFIRRMATSLQENADESSAIKSFSDTIIVKNYTTPVLSISVNDQKNDQFICYESNVKFQASFDNEDEVAHEGYSFRPFFAYEDVTGKKHVFTNKTGTITHDSLFFAATEFCQDTLFSTNSIQVTAGPKLTTTSSEISHGTCLVRGDTVSLSISPRTSYSYAFVLGNDTIESNSIKTPLPYQGSLYYSVIKEKDGCRQSSMLSIQGDVMKEPLAPADFTLLSTGSSVDKKTPIVCAGNVISLFANDEKTSNDISYRWKINDKNLDPTIYTANSLSTNELEYAGTSYDIIRISSLLTNGKVCQTRSDTLSVATYPVITGGSLSAENEQICHESSTSLRLDNTSISGGSGEYTYQWYQVTKDTSFSFATTNVPYIETPSLSENTAFTVNIHDKNCNSEVYLQSTSSVSIDVEKNLSFSLTASPATINSQSLSDGTSVSVTITSDEILPSEKISCWCNGKSIKNKEAYISGISHSLTLSDFIDNMAVFSVERWGENEAFCNHTETIEVLLNEGFDGVPVISSSESIGNSTRLCDGDSAILSIDEDLLPKYDNKSLSINNFSFQWYKKSNESWSTCGNASALKVKASAGQAVEYRCKLSYTPKGGTKQSIYTDIHTLQGIDAVQVGSISFLDNHSKLFYVCKGETGSVSLTVDSLISATQFQWYEKSGDGDWTPVTHKQGTTGADSRLCTIDLENYSSNTSFKLTAINECGVTSESANQIQLIFNAGASLSEDDIIVSSNTIYEGSNLTSVSLCVPKDYKSSYFWSANPTFASSSWHTGNPISLDNDGKGFEQGTDSVFVYRISDGYGNCSSDTIAYHFKVFEKLRTSGISFGSTPDTLCAGVPEFSATLTDIIGGDGSYEIDWFYKTENMTDFLPVEENAHMPFSYMGDYIFQTNRNRSHGILTIGNLTETCEFYAVVNCTGDYPGRSYCSNSYMKYVYDKLQPGDIDSKTLLLCYGDALASIKGDDAKGGDGKYQYQWLKSTDRINWEPISDQTEASYQGQASQEAYKLYQSTYFCRVVTDSCGHSDTSSVKTVQVKSKVITQPDDILATTLVPRGDKASLWGVVNGYNYVWFDKNRMILDTTDVRGIFSSTNIDESLRIYYVKVLYDGCLSDNYDTIAIHTYDIDGGHLSFDDFDKNPDTDKYWICSGANAGRISADGGGNLDYRWFYTINDNGNARAYTLYSSNNTANPVTTPSVLLDTCNLKSVFTHASGTQLEKKISFYRVSYFTINGVEQTENSDTISLYVVPSLGLTASLLLDGSSSMAGSLIADKEVYCPNESGALIDGTVDPTSTLYEIWSNGQFGPYLYDHEAPEFTTWFEFGKDGVWTPEEVHTGIADYAQYYNLHTIDTVYTVRRGFSDGCSTSFSNIIRQNLSDKVPSLSKISIKGSTPDGKTITSGIEIGDALSVNYTELGYDCYWFTDEACTDTLVKNNQLVVFDTVSASTPSALYLKRKDNSDAECFSSPLMIPLTFFTKSDGGIIYKDQFVCNGEPFATILNGKLASGYSQAPYSGTPQQFSYQWQISHNGTSWMNIDGATSPDSLPAEMVNNLLSNDASTYYIRRAATTLTQRTCYSDTVELHFYDELVPGEISLSVDKDKFCPSDSIPSVSSTQPTGGYYGYLDVDGYSYGWEVSLNDGEFITVSKSSPSTGKRLDLEYIIRYSGLIDLDPSQTNIITVRASYYDDCYKVYSNSLSFTLWAETYAPSIYQDKESCDADAVTIKAYNTDKYNFTWIVVDDQGQVTWSYTQDSLRLQRVSDMNVTEYAVVGIDKVSGCQTDYTYFNIDSLPALQQQELTPLSHAVCYNDSIIIEGGRVSGGNGDKEFLWQYSYDQEEFNEISWEENLSLSDLKHSLYVRRIVSDKCASDTSNILFIPVKKKIDVNPTDLVFHDYGCPGQIINVDINKERDSEISELHFWKIDDVSLLGVYNIDGFEGDSKKVNIQLIYVDSLNYECSSEIISYTLHNVPELDSSLNVITCSDLRPCNNSQVTLSGNEMNAENISYVWYQSDNQTDWNIIGKNATLKTVVNGTNYFKRVVKNGCSSITSNILTVSCQESKDFDYSTELSLSIVSHLDITDPSVSLTVRAYVTDGLYSLWGDGEIPEFAYGLTRLPYSPDTYKDSALYISRAGGCFNSYRITPLRGGLIYSDEDTTVCYLGEMPTLISTDVEGGKGSYTYQWLYRNDHVKQYVAIENATEANYKPSPISTRTWYKRVTYSGEYAIQSNVISIGVTARPSLSRISADNATSDSYTSAIKGSDLTLSCTLENVTEYHWQSKGEDDNWTTISSSHESDSQTQLLTTVTDSVSYYRVVASNDCGSDTSDVFKVLLLDIEPISDEDITISGGTCPGDDIIVGLHYSSDYMYKFEGYSGNCYTVKHENISIDDQLYTGEWTDHWISFKDVQSSFDLTIIRKSLKSGATTSYKKTIEISNLEPSFSFVVGNKEYPFSSKIVAIEQGELVHFKNQTKGDNISSYYWELIMPMNTPDGITPYGLYSYQENPDCYFYNVTDYTISLTVTNDKGCSSTVSKNTLYVSESSAKLGHLAVDAEFVEEDTEPGLSRNIPLVYPTYFSNSIHVQYEDRGFHYVLYDAYGRILLSGHAEGETTLNTSTLPMGCYILKVDDFAFKVKK